MVVRCIVHVHITGELAAYWLACFTCICSNVEFTCRGTYICNVADIFAQGHMSSMQNVCLPVLVVTLLIALGLYEVYILT